ncbi:aldehyde ferredoxin oxidoreductase C-terminal domain-containing protein, partial [Thermodesulfobacteriota bacterium]
NAFDPENRFVIMNGPVCGVPGLSGSRWMVSGKSPVHNQFSYCNLGGALGPRLKFAGYDGLVVYGKADRLSYLYIDNDKVELRDASQYRGMGAIRTREALVRELGKSFSVATVGAAGENGVVFSTVVSDLDSSGSNGLGSVMGSKNLKAIAVSGKGDVSVADKEAVRMLRRRLKELKPVRGNTWQTFLPDERMKKEACFGCIGGCQRAAYHATDGQAGKYICQSAYWYEIRAKRFYGEVNEVPFKANKLCDDYGVDTRCVETMIMWLSRCHKAGIMKEEETGLPFSKLGSLEFVETLLHKLCFREGFGDILAEGTLKAAETVGQHSDRLITDYMVQSGENNVYEPRLYITTGLFYATEPRMAIHLLHEVSRLTLPWNARVRGIRENYMTSEVVRAIAKRFFENELAVDYSTYEHKAKTAAMIQDREFAEESLILCDFAWPLMHTPATEDHVGDPSLDSQVFSAVTGVDMDEKGLYRAGERIFNLQRAVLTREGKKGRENDALREFNFTVELRGDYGNPECLVPGKDGEVYSRKGMVLERDKFEKMKDEFYEIRGWDVATGLQTRKTLEGLDLGDVADGMEKEGLLA